MQALLLLSVIIFAGGGSSDAVSDCSNEIRLVSELEYLPIQFSIRRYMGVIGSPHCKHPWVVTTLIFGDHAHVLAKNFHEAFFEPYW